jgi:RimJ/RimL family protein N-acetyltransferase
MFQSTVMPNAAGIPPDHPFDRVRLQTERCLLRPLSHDDGPALLRLHSDPEAMRYWSCAPWQALEEAQAYLEKDRRQRAAGEFLRLAIERRREGDVIGTCDLFEFEPESRRAEIGYGLVRQAWHQGYAAEAVGRLLDYGFDELALNRVEADIDPRNTASARLLERLGFRFEGRLAERWIVAGEVSDSAIYGLIAAWREPFGTGRNPGSGLQA